jgi:ribonuclease HI
MQQKSANYPLRILSELPLLWAWSLAEVPLKEEWRYDHDEPAFAEAGEFHAWIAGSVQEGRSAAAWFVQSVDDPSKFVTDCRVSEERAVGEAGSTEKRAEFAAAVRVCETLQTGSKLVVITHEEYIADAINFRITHWKSNGWRGSNKKQIKNLDIVQRFDAARQARRIQTTARFMPKRDDNCLDSENIATLKERCREEIDKAGNKACEQLEG